LGQNVGMVGIPFRKSGKRNTESRGGGTGGGQNSEGKTSSRKKINRSADATKERTRKNLQAYKKGLQKEERKKQQTLLSNANPLMKRGEEGNRAALKAEKSKSRGRKNTMEVSLSNISKNRREK